MSNEPVAWLINGKLFEEYFRTSELDVIIPLYTHPAEHDLGIAEAIGFEKGHEAGRQLGMKQERALWNLSESTQEIMNAHPVNSYQSITNTKIEPTVVSYTHPVKELTDEEINVVAILQDAEIVPVGHEIWKTGEEFNKYKRIVLATAKALRKAQVI